MAASEADIDLTTPREAPVEVQSIARLRVATASRATQLREAHQRFEFELEALRTKAARKY